jgi:hypothetical protein
MNTRNISIAFALLLLAVLSISSVFALPSGASITSNVTAGTPSPTPDNRSDARGTITTLVINGLQQDQSWKAYVGNITGKLSLDNAAGYTIYDWALSAVNKTGQVYVSRYSSVDFSNVTCINDGNVSAEHVFHNMTFTQTDNVNQTFNYTSHASFFVGTQQITANSCRSTATYINDAKQTMNGNQQFQELVLQDGSDRPIYVTIINANISGYDNNQYDFQMIVPESAVKSTPTTYYFYTQLG